MNKSYLAVILVIMVIALGYFSIQFTQANRAGEELAAQTDVITEALAQIPASDRAELEQELADLRKVLAARQADFARTVNTTSVVERVIQVGAQNNVTVIPLTTRAWQMETVAGYEFMVFRVSVEATGTYAALLNFLAGLETINIGVLLVEDVSMEVTDFNDNTAEMSTKTEVQLAVYTGVPGEE
jgi:Tfp pilus assembly protein PilO